jgi:hypothetical protein
MTSLPSIGLAQLVFLMVVILAIWSALRPRGDGF